MTNDQLLQKLQERRAEHVDNLNARDVQINLFRKQMEDLADDNRVSLAHIEEIDFALEQLKPHSEPAAPPAPAQAAEKRDTLAECIAAIHNVLGERATAATDRAVADELKAATGYRYRISTVRKALAEIGKSSRAGDSSLSPQEEPENPPVDGNPARETDTEMPGFLKRSPKQAAE